MPKMDRLRAQHAEDHLRNRQGTYHGLIDALEDAYLDIPSVVNRLAGTNRELAYEALTRHQSSLDRAHDLVNGVRLFGPAPIAQEAWSILQLVSASYLSARAAASVDGAEVEEPPRVDEFNAAMERLMAEMRVDVAPDR